MALGKKCRIDGCTNILKKQDGQVCGAHRHRFMRHGNYKISPNWPNLKKGQPCITKLGYMRININGKRVLQHRYVMENHLGRKLSETERVHHINGIRSDNRIENLELFKTDSKHRKKYHKDCWKKRKVSPTYKAKTIKKILDSLYKSSNPKKTCFCGKPFMARNLCTKHYQWAYTHNFINTQVIHNFLYNSAIWSI